MAKIYGLFGAMTGKLADTVMSVRNGDQLARKYQPVVFNPSTPAQVAQRAKLKLLSQLSAVMAPVIAIPREGSVSARNLFTKKNFRLTGYADSEATISLAGIQLTSSVVALPDVTSTASAGQITLALASAATDLDSVVYIVFQKTAANEIRLFDSEVVTTPGAGSTFSTTMYAPLGELVVYAYGVRAISDKGRAVFGNLTAPTAETVAKIVVTRTLSNDDYQMTETRGLETTNG